ncbi:YDG domain-containing protein, partial [Sphingomonas sp. 2378]|uniref:YDG domain-containing protein n=1 Tax=Sphingomonas sp. 2378 TaxID=1219748 RepID=UPI00311B15FA
SGTVRITGLVTGDTASATQVFDSRNAGNRLLKVVDQVINDGNDGGNYIVHLVDASGTIARRLVTTGITADNKVYDGTTAATGRYAALTNVLAGDAVGIGAGTMAFADRNAGIGKTVTVTGTTLNGADASNYVLGTIADTTADIGRAALILNASSDMRAYDGTANSAALVQASGLVAGDSVTAVQAFDGKNAGARVLHVVDGSWTVTDGNGGANYIVSIGGTANGAILQRLLTTAVTVNDKEYDGTTAATGAFGGLFNLVGSDQVTLSGGTLAFADRNAGIGKAVTVTGATLSGADAANYALDSIAVGTATITPRALSLQAVADSRIYDGTTVSAGAVLASGLVGGDTVNATQRFDSRHAGSRLLQVADGWTINDGNSRSGRSVALPTSSPATIWSWMRPAALCASSIAMPGSARRCR